MSVRYIGSKSRLVDALAPFVGPPPGPDAAFVDAFCGTGAVAELAADLGWTRVRLNDHLACAVTMAHARLASREDARFEAFGGYPAALAALAALPGRPGFVWREYSPASARLVGSERQYFTEANAQRIDAIRAEIGRWSREGRLGEVEERLLLGDLLAAANHVANIAGTYGCFLRSWSTQALAPLALRPRALRARRVVVEASRVDAGDVAVGPGDLVYLDPPYTKRHYGAYYHLLETITLGDAPEVGGVTGLRPWQHQASDFCYRTRAQAAIRQVVDRLDADRILLSYSSEGHVSREALVGALTGLGRLQVHPLAEIGRYRPNRAARDARASVQEYLVEIDKAAARLARGSG